MFNSDKTDAIIKIFEQGNDMYENHKIAAPILKKMSGDTDFLHHIIEYNLEIPHFLNTKQTYPTLALKVIETAEVNIVVNIFPPLPDRNTEISFQSIHHHGNLLLTTTPAFGTGYKAITFKKDWVTDDKTGITKMEKQVIYNNLDSKIDFIDAFQPHVVFYPKSISATYAMWSKNLKNDPGNKYKRIPGLLRFKKQLRKLIEMAGMEKTFGLAKVENYDFYPNNNQLYSMKERIHYNPNDGSNEHFLKNMFHFIQSTGYHNVNFLAQLLKKSTTPELAKIYINMLINQQEIKEDFIKAYLNVPKVNLHYNDVVNATL